METSGKGWGMLEALETGLGLEIVQWFQLMRSDLLTPIALFFHFAGAGIFYVAVIGTVYWMIDKRLGMRLFFALIIIGLITLLLKELFGRPRPHHIIDGGIMALVADTSYGLPSGHTSMAFVFWGYFAFWMQKRRITIGVMCFVILMGLSRMYLGVHFPQDVVGGLILGAIVLTLYYQYVERVVDWWHEQVIWIQLGSPILLGIITIVVLNSNEDGLTLAGLLIGAAFGIVLETRFIHFDSKNQWSRRILQSFLGLVIAIGILQGLDILFDRIEPPTYAYVVEDATAITALQAEINVINGTALEVCPIAFEVDLSNDLLNVCEVQTTPLSAILRIIRYSIVAIFAISIIPYLSIKLNLMKQMPSHQSA